MSKARKARLTCAFNNYAGVQRLRYAITLLTFGKVDMANERVDPSTTELPSCPTLALLKARCEANGQRLTPLREQVLALLFQRGGRATAYQLIDALPSLGRRATPPSVYRSLEFLIEVGVVKRLFSTNTFVMCDDATIDEHAIFLVCTRCSSTVALEDQSLARAISQAAESASYGVAGQQTEVKGICCRCLHAPQRQASTAQPSRLDKTVK
ncbi:FUR family transcriptional regulator [Caballeronia sordidicola]|uniref:FUR family transcriptional regulator n=1 Tax=Caballeronia sordidicola TaxID=196367 RepID=A0A158IDM2_CABSO|nr:FUR family transcriptional regulator [Caballeronia sordidicola]